MTEKNTATDGKTFEWNQDHGCHREGIADPVSNSSEWDLYETDNLAVRLADNARHRILTPLVMVQMWMFHRTYTLAKKYMTEEQAQEFFNYWRWASDLQTEIEQRGSEIAALVVQNLPAKLTSLDEMLTEAMAESGFCCPTNIDAFILGHMPDYRIPEMGKTCPDFKPEWLSIEGQNAPLERD